MFVVNSQHMRRHIQKLTIIASVLMLLFVSIVHADVGGGSTSSTRERIGYLSAGDTHTCVVLVDNSVKCFGLGSEGQLGNESTSNIGDGIGASVASSLAISLGSGRSARAIATGASHSCALLDNMSVKCWGSGLYGRTGYGDSDNRGDNTGEMGDALPAVDLGTERTATMIAVGANHSCALLDNATLKCWGRNSLGQLGYSDTTTRGDNANEMGDSLPAVAFATGRTPTAVVAGAQHTCALLDNAQMVCWGDNDYGQLGQGSMTAIGNRTAATVANTPTINVGTGRSVVAMSAGDLHTCALLDDAHVKCWGMSSNGRLGTGDTDDRGDDPLEMGDALLPIDLGVGLGAVAVSAGGEHTCVLLTNSSVKCFGNGMDGRLGYGNQNSIGDGSGEMGDALATVNLGTGRSVLAVSAGGAHTCAMLDNAEVKCWGNGGSGRRGSESTTRAGTSTLHMGDNLVALSAGALINTGTTTTTTTTTVVITTTSTTTAVAPTVAPVAAPTTTSSTTTSTTSPVIVPTTIARATSAPIVVNTFANSSAVLSIAQKKQLARFAIRLRAGDTVWCVAYQESNALGLVTRLTVRRSQAVCRYLRQRVAGISARPSTQFITSAKAQSATASPMPVRAPASMARRVGVRMAVGG